jgi:hypothetical protein
VEGDPVKMEFLRLRAQLRTGQPSYDLRAARHFEPVLSLAEYEEQGVEYFVLTGDHFGAARLDRDKKHSPRTLESRRRLLQALASNPRATLVFALDPGQRNLQGPSVEIYRLSPAVVPAS